MRRQLRQILRPAAAAFVEQLVKNAIGHENLVISEALEAIREEAAARGWNGGRMLIDVERAALIQALRERDAIEAKDILLQQGEAYFFAWLERKLAHHVPYRTLSDAALVALRDFDTLYGRSD